MGMCYDSHGNIPAQAGWKTSDLDERFAVCFYPRSTREEELTR